MLRIMIYIIVVNSCVNIVDILIILKEEHPILICNNVLRGLFTEGVTNSKLVLTYMVYDN